MHLIYYSHSYRPADNDINEFVQDLMLGEGLTPSLDPPSDRLNSAKPERHLKSTDAMIAVLPSRDPAPSIYILYEISLAARAGKPILVFLEDVLSDSLIPQRLLQRRFSRRHLLRQLRTHKHALASLKAYIGSESPPAYQPSVAQRSCLMLGVGALPDAAQCALTDLVTSLKYQASLPGQPPEYLCQRTGIEASATDAAFSIVLLDELTPFESYLLGTLRGALVPTILLTANPKYPFNPAIPREYQPRLLGTFDSQLVCSIVSEEIAIFEEDYLDVLDQGAVHRYRHALLTQTAAPGNYSSTARDLILNVVTGNLEVDMSKDKIQVQNVVGPVNIKSRLDHVTQMVNATGSLKDADRQALSKLIEEMKDALRTASEKRPEEADRVASSMETVTSELAKSKPDKPFLNISLDGLKQAAKALEDIAPSVLTTAGRIAAFVTGLAL